MPRSREREIKRRIRVRVERGKKIDEKQSASFFSHTHITSSQFLVVLLD